MAFIDARVVEDTDGVNLSTKISNLSKAPNEYEWIATDGQLTFMFPPSASYDIGSKWLQVSVGGGLLPDSAVRKDSSTQFTLLLDPSDVPLGVTVAARWVQPYIPASAGHQLTHQKGGTDELDITTLKNYKEQVSDQIGIVSNKVTDIAINAKYPPAPLVACKCDGVTDDTTALNNILSGSALNGVKKVILPPNSTTIVSQTITIDTVALVGYMSVIQSSATKGVIIKSGIDRSYLLDGIRITGNGATVAGSVGISFESSTSGNNQRDLRKVTVNGWESGVKFSNNSYLITVYDSKFFGNKYSVNYPSGLTNSGENIKFYNCVFSDDGNTSCDSQIYGQGFGALSFYGCSFDYTPKKAFNLAGRCSVYVYGGHIETRSNLTATIIDVINDGSSFTMFGGTLILTDRDSAGFTLPNIVTVGAGAKVLFNGTTMDDCVTTSGYFYTGTGVCDIINMEHYPYSQTFKRLGTGANLLYDGGFDNATDINAMPDIVCVYKGTVAPTSSSYANSIQLSLDATTKRTGAKSLKIQKWGVTNDEASVIIAVPISRGVKCGQEVYLRFNDNNGSLNVRTRYAKIFPDGYTYRIGAAAVNQDKNITADNTLGWQRLTFETDGFDFIRAPYWATHYVIIFDMKAMSAGIMNIDDVVITEIK